MFSKQEKEAMNSHVCKFLGITVVFVYVLMAVSSVIAQDVKAPATAPAAAPAVAPAAAPAAPAAAPAAAEPKAPTMPPALELRKTGVVSVAKDASGKVTGIKLIVTSYDIILDEGSKPLESMDGQKVRVTCTFSQQEGRRCLTVKSVEPVPADEMKAPGMKPAETKAPEKPAEAPAK